MAEQGIHPYDPSAEHDTRLSGSRSFKPFIIGFFVVLMGIAVYQTAFLVQRTNAIKVAHIQATIYVQAVRAKIATIQNLPFILAHDFLVRDTLKRSENSALLEDWFLLVSARAGISSLTLLDEAGDIVVSTLQQDRPNYTVEIDPGAEILKEAFAGRKGQELQFVGETGAPIYVTSEPVFDDDRNVIGALVAQLPLTDIERNWRIADDTVLVVDADRQILLSDDPGVRQRTLHDMSNIREEDNFGAMNAPISWRSVHSVFTMYGLTQEVRFQDATFLVAEQNMNEHGWQVYLLTDLWPVRFAAIMWLWLFAGVVVVAIMFAFLKRSRLSDSALSYERSDSANLRRMNFVLEKEIQDRRTAENKLRAAEVELKRSHKLAALGQLAASVNHELGQPITAMRNYLAVANRLGTDEAAVTGLQRIGDVVLRMQHIFDQLKFFARTDTGVFRSVNIHDVIAGAVDLLGLNIEAAEVKLTLDSPPDAGGVWVIGNQFRLEQVLVNVLRNAIDAIEENDDDDNRRIAVSYYTENDDAVIRVEDTGQGLTTSSIDDLTEAFVSTRASGKGMGLGLTISATIIRDHEGSMSAGTTDQHNTFFEIRLRTDIE